MITGAWRQTSTSPTSSSFSPNAGIVQSSYLPDMEWDLRFDTASFLQYFSDRMSLAGLQTITGINRKQLSHYVTGHSRPSAATVRKIQAGIDRFSQQLSRVCLI